MTTVVVEVEKVSVLEVTSTQQVVIFEEKVTILEVGIQGPPGAGGAGGSGNYFHAQASADSPWVINHNLGRKVAVEVFTVGGVRVLAGAINVSDNQLQVIFDLPMAGYAVIN